MKRTLLKQYFTPLSVARFITANTFTDENTMAADPASGEGVFLEALKGKPFKRFVAADLDSEALNRMRGRDPASVKIINGDGLDPKTSAMGLKEGTFDLILANPPFSSQKNRIRRKNILHHYVLGGKSQSQEVLFLEKSIRLLKPGGLLRIILPVSVLANTALRYVRGFILKNLHVEAVVELPPGIFPHTPARTAVLFAVRKTPSAAGEPSRLIKIDDERILDNLDIRNAGCGVLAGPHELAERMDPSYYLVKEKTEEILARAAVSFTPLGHMARIRTGFCRYKGYGDFITQRKESLESPVLLMRARNVTPFGLKPSSAFSYIEKNSPVYRHGACPERGEICMVRVGAGCIGRAFLIDESFPPCQADDWMFILKSDTVEPEYLSFYLNSSLGRFLIRSLAHGTGAVSISKNRLSQLPVALAEQECQKMVASAMKRVRQTYRRDGIKEARKLFSQLDEKFKGALKIDLSE